MNCAFMFAIIIEENVFILLPIEPCNVMLKVMSDIMAHWYEMINALIINYN